jgi:cytoskeletal protein RodZ
MTLGKMLREARESKDMTTTFVALRVDIKPSFLIMIEKGDKYPTSQFFVDLCRMVGVDPVAAYKLYKKEKVKLYEQRLNREFSEISNQ